MLQVIHEDNHLIAVNKPVGYLSQGDNTGDLTIMDYVKEYIKLRYNKPGDVFLGNIHRLDRPTSGAILFARTSKALTRMNALIKDRKFNKTYLCITSTRPPQPRERLVHHLVKNTNANYVTVYDKSVDRSKKAILTYQLLAQIDGKFLIQIDLETGRPHQIRAQMSHIGSPLVGDTKYGGMKWKVGEICLHSWKIGFIHPVKKEAVEIIASTPDDHIWNLFRHFTEK